MFINITSIETTSTVRSVITRRDKVHLYRAKIQSRFSRKQSFKRKIFILYLRLLFSRRIIPLSACTTSYESPCINEITLKSLKCHHSQNGYTYVNTKLCIIWNYLTRWLPCVFSKKSPSGHACSSTKRSLPGAPIDILVMWVAQAVVSRMIFRFVCSQH